MLTGACGLGTGQPVAERLPTPDLALMPTPRTPVGGARHPWLATYASLIAGELVPNNLRCITPERIAIFVAPMTVPGAHCGSTDLAAFSSSSGLVFRRKQ